MGLNALELFYVPLYTEFLSDFYKTFQVASTHDTKFEHSAVICF